jgi:hypothetical protein
MDMFTEQAIRSLEDAAKSLTGAADFGLSANQREASAAAALSVRQIVEALRKAKIIQVSLSDNNQEYIPPSSRPECDRGFLPQ